MMHLRGEVGRENTCRKGGCESSRGEVVFTNSGFTARWLPIF